MADKTPEYDLEKEDLNIQVTLELGTNEFKAVATRKTEDGRLNVLAVDTCPSKGMERGYIKNVDDAAGVIIKLCKQLQNRLDSMLWAKSTILEERKNTTISGVYVALGGKSIMTRENKVERKLGSQKITKDLLDEFMRDNYNSMTDRDKEILDVIPEHYIVDDEDTDSPVGCPCDVIVAKYKLIIGETKLKANLLETLSRAGKELKGYVLSPIAASESVLNSVDKELGCMVVDFGASTINVAIYNKEKVNYVHVLPFGSSLLNSDLEQLKMARVESERLKMFIPCIPTGSNDLVSLPLSHKEISVDQIACILESRIDQICAYIAKVLEVSNLHAGYDLEKLYLVGNGSKLKGFQSKVSNALGLNAQYATFNESLLANPEAIKNPLNFATVLGAAYLSDTKNCVSAQLAQPRVKKKNTKWQSVKDTLGSLFDGTSISATGTPKK